MDLDRIQKDLMELSLITREEVGESEENVKHKLAVPLLEILGHHRNK